MTLQQCYTLCITQDPWSCLPPSPPLPNCHRSWYPACGGLTAHTLCWSVEMMKGLGVSQQLWTCLRTSQGGDCVVEASVPVSSHLFLPGILSSCLISFFFTFVTFVSLCVVLTTEETANRFLPFPFTPLKHHWSLLIPSEKTCLRHYSILSAVAILMDLERGV